MNILENLNQQQREAVEFVNGPLLILAGPGSGKTRVIVHRIANLVQNEGVNPYHIAAVTFTNKAAKEMRSRLESIMGSDFSAMTVGTFHSFCASVLRRDGHHLGLDKAFVIYDQEDQIAVIKKVMDELEIDAKRISPRAILAPISSAKSQLMDPSDYVNNLAYGLGGWNPLKYEMPRIYQRYQELLSSNTAVDFDDLLLNVYIIFRDNTEILGKYQSRYTHLLIDEFQDTNLVQYAIARQIAGKHRNICVVGDPDQSIYSWRNADIRNILSFQNDYTEATVVRLEENYRSTENIVEASHAVISANLNRVDKLLRTQNERGELIFDSEALDPEDEARQVVREIERLRRDSGNSLSDFAVMYRVNAQSRALEEVCMRYGIPYQLIGGLRFYQRKEIKDVIAYLRVIQNPYDEVSLLRIINVPSRGIGSRTVSTVVQMARDQKIPVYSALQLLAERPDLYTENFQLPARSSQAVARFLNLLNGFIDDFPRLTLEDLITIVIERTGYSTHLMEDVDRGHEKRDNLEELRSTALEFQQMTPDESLTSFLEGVALVSDIDTLEDQQDAITLITLHQAKGLEFPVVFIVGLEEGLLPHFRSYDSTDQMEEERRLLYVGMTRAMDRLYLFKAMRRGFRGNGEPGRVFRPSQFLSDIPKQLITPLLETRNNADSSASLGFERVELRDTVTSVLPVEIGKKIRHARFGDGIVVSCLPSGEDYEVTVAFKGASGIKKLLLSYAHLDYID